VTRDSRSLLRARHGVIALLAALAVHAAVFARLPMALPDGAAATGNGGITVSLAMTAARAGSETEAVATPEPVPTDAAPQILAAQPAVPEIEQADTAPEIAAMPVAATATTAAPTEAASFSPLSAVAALVAAPVDVIAVKAPVVVPPRPRPAARKPTIPPRAVPPAPTTVAATPPRRAAVTASVAPPETPVTKTAPNVSEQTTTAANTGSGQVPVTPVRQGSDIASLPGGGAVGNPSRDYMSQLRYWLDRNKTYPKDARRKRMQGVVHLYFRVTRDGIILDFSIRKSSGYAVLDAEATAMLKRAVPLPKFSASMKGGYLDVTVPVEFSLRGNS